jgi:hypothetical protein
MICVGAMGLLVAGGCQRAEHPASETASSTRGRYVGLGIYAPQQMWAQLARPGSPQQDPRAATLDDDEQIIVVIDSMTGEVRQCGNLSGHCIGMNPWSKAASLQGAPAALVKHARELAEDAQLSVSVRQAP